MSFRFGGIKINEMHFGNNKVTEVYFGVNKIYPEKQPEPQPAITYVISNILIHISSGDKIKVNGSNYAFVTAAVAEYHDGVLYNEYNETVTSFGFNPKFIVNGDRLSYNVQDYGRTETSTQNVNVQFTLHNNTYTVAIPVEANIATVQNIITLYATSTPSSVIIPQGERIYLYPEYRKTVRTTYTSGYIDDDFQGNTYGTCYIYFTFGGGSEQLWGDDVAVTTSGAAQTFDIPANMFIDQNIRARIAPSTVEGEDYTDCSDVILNFSQKAMAKHKVTWSIERLSYMMVSMAYDEYEPLPKEVVAGTNLLFYIRKIENCDVTVKQNGIDITERVAIYWEDDSETISVTVENVQGNLEIILYGYPLNPLPIISKFRINSSSCIACGSCYNTCKFKDAVYKDGDVFAINADKCLGCGECSEPCPNGSIEEYMP